MLTLYHQYIKEVTTGQKVVCKYVRQAVERQVNDLKRKPTPDFPYYFDEAEAARWIGFISILKHTSGEWKGREFCIQDFQAFRWACIFGWQRVDGRGRRFRRAYVEVARKQGKTEEAATIGLGGLLIDGEPTAQIFSAATTRQQAKIVYSAAKIMARELMKDSEGANETLRLLAHRILNKESDGFFEALSSDAWTLDGLSPHVAIIDEYHAHPTNEVLKVIETGMGARRSPLIYIITTAGFNISSPCFMLRQNAIDILRGQKTDETFFTAIYTLDLETNIQSFNFVQSFNEIEKLCNCGCVQTAQINQAMQKVFANAVIPKTIDQELLKGVSTTLTGQQEHSLVNYAEPVTNNHFLTKTQTENKNLLGADLSGLKIIKTELEPLMTDGEVSQSQSNAHLTEIGLKGTGLLQKNTTGVTLSKKENARYVENLKKYYAWIIATIQKEYGDFSAHNATQQLACSEIMKAVCNAHSNTCKVREVEINKDGGIKVVMPPDDWNDENVWIKANPQIGNTPTWDFMRSEYTKAVNEGGQSEVEFKTKNLNVWTASSETWIQDEIWQACPNELDNDSLLGKPCYVGVDFAAISDFTAAAFLFPPHGDRKEYALKLHFWLPEDKIKERARDWPDTIKWWNEGYIKGTPGNVVDLEILEQDFKGLCAKYDVKVVGYDPLNAWQTIANLETSGLKMDRYPNTRLHMSPASKEFERLVRQKMVNHGGNPVLRWMMTNVVPVYTQQDLLQLDRMRSSRISKIDGVVASVIALGEHLKNPVAEVFSDTDLFFV